MQVPKKFLQKIIPILKKSYVLPFSVIYYIENTNFMFFLDGHLVMFFAFSGESLPQQIDTSALRYIRVKDVQDALPQCGDMVEINAIASNAIDFDFNETMVPALNEFLAQQGFKPEKDFIYYSYSDLSKIFSIIKTAATKTPEKDLLVKLGFSKNNIITLKANTKELECLAASAAFVTPE